MLVHVEAVVGVVMAREQLFEREGVGELIHAAFRPVQRNAGHSLLEYRCALTTGQVGDGCPAACIIWDTPARAEVLQVGMHLRTHGHGRSPYRAFDGAALLDEENALSCNMTIRSMLAGLKEGHLILISFDAKSNITTTFVAVQAVERDARETFLSWIA